MARKSTPKAPLDLSLEAYPAFVAQVAALADVDPATFPELACRFAEQYHDAMLAEDMASLELAEMAYPALVYALNGGTFFGCKAGPDSAGYVLERAAAARAGQVPSWGQAGEFLLELEGVRICVKLTSNMLGNHRSVDLHAVDWDKPFISSTGYRNVVLTAANHQGRTVDQALRLVVEDVLEREGGLVAIDAEYGKARRENPPAWLADALAGVRPDGQLNMFGDVPKDPTIKAPMSNAERQKALRLRRKQQQLKPVMLSEPERLWLDRFREQWAGMPGLGEFVQAPDGVDFSTLSVTDAALLSVWERLPTDHWRMVTALGLLRQRNRQHFELVCAVRVLKGRLRAAGMDERVSDYKQEWHWNPEPLRDYRVTSAPETMERDDCTTRTLADQLKAAQQELEHLKAESEQRAIEQSQARADRWVLMDRLRSAGLSTDVERLPGE
ncbi:hypothetical protein AUC61_23825 [Pseudomonas sp. S25]|uniref:Uncharacterized protein n=1 Tax=Pseudomonas maioricensis TaxID=1766623 RepID=A0ABS9ZPQ8_9PSED|nr:hypothetical protein [Pseudomonas sp. S25]MCI8212564.1 hypothetical protein [Pseudomonas sp. S25]